MLELDDDKVHYVGNQNNFSAPFSCMYFFSIVRHCVILIFNTKRPISSFSLSSVAKDVRSSSRAP